jgi:hypothetical protein
MNTKLAYDIILNLIELKPHSAPDYLTKHTKRCIKQINKNKL